MATRQSAQKVTRRASLNFPLGNEGEKNQKSNKKTINKIKKQAKNIGMKAWLVALLVLVVGVGAGIGAFYLTSKNDCFTLVGNEELTLTIGEAYEDQGVSIKAFGKDISNKVLIDTNLKIDDSGNYYSEEVGTFYIRYYTNEIKYGSIFKVEKIRLITFVEPAEIDEIESANEGV